MRMKKLGLLIGTMAMVAVLPLAWPRVGSDRRPRLGGGAIPGGDGQGLIKGPPRKDKAEAAEQSSLAHQRHRPRWSGAARRIRCSFIRAQWPRPKRIPAAHAGRQAGFSGILGQSGNGGALGH